MRSPKTIIDLVNIKKQYNDLLLPVEGRECLVDKNVFEMVKEKVLSTGKYRRKDDVMPQTILLLGISWRYDHRLDEMNCFEAYSCGEPAFNS